MKKRQIRKALNKAWYWAQARDGAAQWMMRNSCAKVTGREKAYLREEIKMFEKEVHDTFRQACIDVIGEDPDTDWN